jgi:DNA-directed RNA polymerase specialized sigma24 family protein
MIIQSYNDILAKISALEIWINSLERDKKYYTKLLHNRGPKDITAITFDGMPKGTRNDMTLDRILESLHKVESHLILAEEELLLKTQSRIDIENVLSKMEGIEYQVFYFRVVRGLTQEQTAEMIEKSDRHIRRVEKNMVMSGKCPVAVLKKGL